jgi:hypothetical protein
MRLEEAGELGVGGKVGWVRQKRRVELQYPAERW